MKEFYIANKTYIDIAIGAVIFAAFFLLRKVLTKFLLTLVGKLLFMKKPELRNGFVESLTRPVSFFFALLGLYLGVYFNFQKPAVTTVFKILIIAFAAWCAISFISQNLQTIFDLRQKSASVHGVAVKFISNILIIITLCLAAVMIVSELGYNINGLITGLGVGGLAVSLAAQDSLKNLISGFVILYDKPFVLGDLIETPDYKGFVEDITMRSTRLRRLDDAVIVVPNSALADAYVTNYAKLNKRLSEFKIGLLYSTESEALKKCADEIREYLLNEESVDNETVRVCFSDYGESSVDLTIRFYTDIVDIELYNKFMEALNYKIKEIVENNDTDFAYPTRSIRIEKE